MKKITLILGITFLALSSFGQFGVSGGLNLTTFRNGVEKDRGIKPSLTGGVYDRIYLGKSISLQPELRYERKGTLINYEPNGEQFNLLMGYVTLPVAVNIHITKNLAVGVGYYGGYLVHSNINKWNYEYTINEFKPTKFHTLDHGYFGTLSYDCYGMIVSADVSMGNRIIGVDGGPFGRRDITADYNHVYKSLSGSFQLKIPFAIHK